MVLQRWRQHRHHTHLQRWRQHRHHTHLQCWRQHRHHTHLQGWRQHRQSPSVCQNRCQNRCQKCLHQVARSARQQCRHPTRQQSLHQVARDCKVIRPSPKTAVKIVSWSCRHGGSQQMCHHGGNHYRSSKICEGSCCSHMTEISVAETNTVTEFLISTFATSQTQAVVMMADA